jgi:hypothetical protein
VSLADAANPPSGNFVTAPQLRQARFAERITAD